MRWLGTPHAIAGLGAALCIAIVAAVATAYAQIPAITSGAFATRSGEELRLELIAGSKPLQECLEGIVAPKPRTVSCVVKGTPEASNGFMRRTEAMCDDRSQDRFAKACFEVFHLKPDYRAERGPFCAILMLERRPTKYNQQIELRELVNCKSEWFAEPDAGRP